MKFNFELLKLYKNVSLKYKFYTLIRSAVCPFDEIEKFVPAGKSRMLDCGCGHGIFSNLLAMKSDKRHVIGIDINRDKIKVANSTLGLRKNIEFKVGNLRETEVIKDIRCFTFIDVLCYIPLGEKKELLKKIYNILPVGGTLIIKSMQEFPRWKHWLILFHMATIDRLMHNGLKGNSYFVKKEQYLDLLKGIGFEVKFNDISKGYPYPDCLYICTKIN